MEIPGTTERVHINTAQKRNQINEKETERRIRYFAANPAKIGTRLKELDKEWDIERTLEANAAAVSMISVALGMLVNRKWFFMPAVVGAFLLNHAVKGWCPPLPLFRRMGVRTHTEIERERYALKALRGDFHHLTDDGGQDAKRTSRRILQAVK